MDLNKVAIPQADEQQRLLANLILKAGLHRKPLPRFWYLSRGLKAAVVMTGDDHGNNGTHGTPDAPTYVSRMLDGELVLKPALGEELGEAGPGLPGGWAAFPWATGGSATVGGGLLALDGARANTEPPPGVAAPVAMDFAATFRAAPYQRVGFGAGADVAPGEIFNTAPWAIFSTGAAGTSVLARTWSGGTQFDIPISAGLYFARLGTPEGAFTRALARVR